MMPPLTPAEARELADAGQITLLDVRELAEVQASGLAKGAVHIPLAMIPLRANRQAPDHDPLLDPAKPVAIYCAAGARAGRAADLLTQLGYTAHNIGGFADWCAAGGEVER